jgi:hypothetical protein
MMPTFRPAHRLLDHSRPTFPARVMQQRKQAEEPRLPEIDPTELTRAYTLLLPALDSETPTKLAVAEAEIRGLRDLLAEVTRSRDSFEQVIALTAAPVALAAATRSRWPRRAG